MANLHKPIVDVPRWRDRWNTRWGEIRWAFKAVWGSPLSAATVIVCFALGIGLWALMFVLVDPFVFRSLPYQQPAALVAINPAEVSPQFTPTKSSVSDWQARTEVFAGVAAYADPKPLLLRLRGQSVALTAAPVSGSFFRVMGVPGIREAAWATAGKNGRQPIVLTSDSVFGQNVEIGTVFESAEGRSWQVVGILPSSFIFPYWRPQPRERIRALIPLGDERIQVFESSPDGGGRGRTLLLIGRLQPHISLRTAAAALARTPGQRAPTLVDLHDAMTRRFRGIAWGALAAGVLIFLACATNVGNILLMRQTYRAPEFATRMALGATKADVGRLAVLEVGVMAFGGVLLGLVMAWGGLRIVNLLLPPDYVALGVPELTLRAVTAAVTAGFAVTLASSGLTIALPSPCSGALIASTQRGVGVGHRRLRFVLTASQSAIAMVLLTACVLMLRSFSNLVTQDIGFASDALAVSVVYRKGPEPLEARVNETVRKLRFIVGVSEVAAVRGPLADDGESFGAVRANGRRVLTAFKAVTPNYFRTAGVPLLAGRLMSAVDGGNAVVVNAAFVKECCRDRSPLGALLDLGTRAVPIVGVVADSYDFALDRKPTAVMFQLLGSVGSSPINSDSVLVHYVLRTASTGEVKATAEREVRKISPRATAVHADTLGAKLWQTVRERSLASLLLSLFGVCSTAISAAGLAGLVAFAVVRRTREIAIRAALGAQGKQLRWLVVREPLSATLVGSGVGLIAGGVASRGLAHLLYGIEPADATSLALAAAAMLAFVGVAAVLPARRANHLSPTEALRFE